ncbi:hypothetical protein [Marinobacter orientalis]|uniref:Uncharacterized protein n=1 Tax=Marinobacter orientalis TaxID=1928859 RepID=A0A7Y0RFE6_9GAMM|nr:hypothetical protein [Marinobacter orientalis]NMT65218.1 hypothetical protein [Marinobacter orientalis]TGX48012.1 hypothetical protein DIT72_16515 [Marinobacter orientalis]
MGVLDKDKSGFDVAGYWEQRYKSGRNSGSGSYGRLAKFKADYINGLIDRFSIKNVVELGCGDGNQLSIIDYPSYVGLDISKTIVDACNEKFEKDKSKEFFLYNPESYDVDCFRRELAISLDVIYHLSNDEIYFTYLKHLFHSASRFVVVYSNSQSLYRGGVNEDAQYIRFRNFNKDVEQLFPDWKLIEVEPNFYPFNPSLREETSIADFYVYALELSEQEQVSWKESDELYVSIQKLLNKASVSDEQNQLILDTCKDNRAVSEKSASQIFAKIDEIEKKQIDSCFNKYEILLKRFFTLEDQLQREHESKQRLNQELQEKSSEIDSFVRTHDRKIKDLVKSHASEIHALTRNHETKIGSLESDLRTLKRELTQIRHSVRYQVGYHIVRARKSWHGALALPIALLKIVKRRMAERKTRSTGANVDTKKAKTKLSAQTPQESTNIHDQFFDFVARHPESRILKSRAIIYGDVSPNVLDGSSIWLTSIANIISSDRPTTLLLKDNIANQKVVSNLAENDNLIVVEPKDLGFNAPLTPEQATLALSLMYSHCPRVTAVITRGVDVGYEVQKRKEFSGAFYPYITDFYEITEGGFSLVESKVTKLKEVALNAKAILFQTDEIHRKIEETVGYKVDGCKLPPTIPDEIGQYFLPTTDDKRIHVGYAGKIQPNWGVEELIDEVGKLVSLGYDIKLHIATGKIHESKKGSSGFVERVKGLLDQEFVQLYQDLPRNEALALVSKMDLVWCYRDPNLEDSTLELSTKLVETASLGKPCVAYASEINKNFLGPDYPFLIRSLGEVSGIIASLRQPKETVKKELEVLSNYVIENYSFSALRSTVSEKLDEDTSEVFFGKRIAISGHDLKFIYPYITHLRRQGADVGIDPWDWGSNVSPDVTQHYASWADYIFCEWGLANAVWHSKNKKEGKKLFVRIHAQEVRKKAEKFGHAIDAYQVDSFVFVSSLIREQAFELFDWPKSKTIIIPNGVKKNRFFKAGGKIGPFLGIVGIVPTTKRLDRALDLLEVLNERGWGAKLYCKGQRPEELPFMQAPGRRQELTYYEELYKKIANNPHLKGHVIFDGWGNDVEQWYKKVDFILSPSDNESFHYALADGAMAGCIPLMWPWKGAVETYTSEWVVKDNEEAVNRVEFFLNASQHAIEDFRLSSKKLVSDKFYENDIFRLLDNNFLGLKHEEK